MPTIGDMLRFGNYSGADESEAFTSLSGTAADPDAVVLTIRRPDHTTLVYGWPLAGADGLLEREAAGRFYADVVIDQSGEWTQHMVGAGTVNAVAQDRHRIARSYLTAVA
jgi:hypothetical protein